MIIRFSADCCGVACAAPTPRPTRTTGIVAASYVPTDWGLEFTGTLALIALVGPALKARPALVGAVAAGVVALLAHGLPYRLGLFVAAIVGIFAATLADDRRPRETAVDSGSTS